MPPRAKINDEWCRKVGMASFAEGIPIDAEKAALSHILEGATAAAKLVGRNQTAALLYQVAVNTATPGRDGRPPGSGTHDRDRLNELIQDVLTHDDGSVLGRRRAITAAVANEPDHQRPALKQWLRKHLPPLLTQNFLHKTKNYIVLNDKARVKCD